MDILLLGAASRGEAIIASAFLLVYLGCRGRIFNEVGCKITESLSGLVFIVMGLIGLTVGGTLFFYPISC